jgi:hypothetical protein
MEIKYWDPLSKAFDRMKGSLFRPFDINKWFVVGFTAFLAGLLNGNPFFSFPSRRDYGNIGDLARLPERIMGWSDAHPILFTVILLAIVVCIIIILILTWLASRGAFMFLDNVAGDRARIAAPWRLHRRLGNSLFLWRVGFGFICLLITLPLIALGFFSLMPLWQHHDVGKFLLIFIGFAAAGVLMGVVMAYISMCTGNFVVPIMYKYNLKAMAAWGIFMPLLSNHLGSFFVYGLCLLLLMMAIGIAIGVLGCLTCCLFFIASMIPYIGAVILLPVSYTYRTYSLEFLAQFGPDYDLFAVPPPPPDGIQA